VYARARVLGEGDPEGEARAVADYVAGMTDRFALAEHRRLLDPHEPC
jgi:dGTPase